MFNGQTVINFSSLHKFRKHELKILSEKFIFRKNSKLLEIGSGTGYQLDLLKEKIDLCLGLDIENGTYDPQSLKEIIKYDGINIPFENDTFDYVFSSNTLEHITDLNVVEKEIQRVMKEDGTAIHILPTSTWRLYTILTHPIYIIKFIFLYFSSNKISQKKYLPPKGTNAVKDEWTLINNLYNFLIPKRHGEKGNLLTEFYFFSEFYWKRHFLASNWKVVGVFPSNIAYSGNQVFSFLPITVRTFAAALIGSSTKIYILRKLPKIA